MRGYWLVVCKILQTTRGELGLQSVWIGCDCTAHLRWSLNSFLKWISVERGGRVFMATNMVLEDADHICISSELAIRKPQQSFYYNCTICIRAFSMLNGNHLHHCHCHCRCSNSRVPPFAPDTSPEPLSPFSPQSQLPLSISPTSAR